MLHKNMEAEVARVVTEHRKVRRRTPSRRTLATCRPQGEKLYLVLPQEPC